MYSQQSCDFALLVICLTPTGLPPSEHHRRMNYSKIIYWVNLAIEQNNRKEKHRIKVNTQQLSQIVKNIQLNKIKTKL